MFRSLLPALLVLCASALLNAGDDQVAPTTCPNGNVPGCGQGCGQNRGQCPQATSATCTRIQAGQGQRQGCRRRQANGKS